MIQVNAGTRLVAAKADAAKAYKYLTRLGLKVSLTPIRDRDGAIEFKLEGAMKDAAAAITNVTKIKMRKSDMGPVWDITPDRRIVMVRRDNNLYVWLIDRS